MNNRCIAKNKDGSPCKNNAMQGRSTCYIKAHSGDADPLSRIWNFATNNKLIAILLVAFGLIGGPLGVPAWWQHHSELRHAATAGVLTADQKGEWQLVTIGGHSLFAFRSQDGVIFRDGETNYKTLLSARKVRNGLFGKHWVFSLPVQDEHGNLIAEIHDNEWQVQRSVGFDRNYTDHILEVRDATGDVAMQLADLGDVLYVAGTFRCRDGRKVRVGPVGPGGAVVFDFTNQDHPAVPLQPICEPSELHLGECADRRSLSQVNLDDPNGKAIFIGHGPDIEDKTISLEPGGLNLCP